MEPKKPCCAAGRAAVSLTPQEASEHALHPSSGHPEVSESPVSTETAGTKIHLNWAELAGGTFRMGSDDPDGFPADGEGPSREVSVRPFRISSYAVTNAQFRQFVEATGYVTEAERFGWSYVFHLLVSESTKAAVKQAPHETPWWYAVQGADWAHPEGPDSDIEARLNHPVIHVSWNDAVAFCDFTGTRLPTEAEWEFAARGGLAGRRYPWGDELKPGGEHRCNIWQGRFPVKNSAQDGYIGTAPVDTYEPNGYGLYNMSGNVWEWCADYWSPGYHHETSADNPFYSRQTDRRSMRGGSYLCHRSYCNRYRLAARSSNTPDTSTGNAGFRVAADRLNP
ncbi:formylglycine-generating enzyme family protein [Paenibacillus daejeonensis]|uniref:formylglycine-generating enzyme family protein n=1 Tax=Paenibacillus daejeonensis TaxID=135193 RepID=UPI0009FC0F21